MKHTYMFIAYNKHSTIFCTQSIVFTVPLFLVELVTCITLRASARHSRLTTSRTSTARKPRLAVTLRRSSTRTPRCGARAHEEFHSTTTLIALRRYLSMARATRRRAASPPVEPETAHEDDMEVEDEPAQTSAAFEEPLTWRAGRPIAVSDLLRRLRNLHEELAAMEQFEEEDDAGRAPVAAKAQELANAQLMGHRDKGVKAWTVTCIVQVFRILAPNAPFTERQMREIFSYFVSHIVPTLATPSSPYQQQYMDILKSLVDFKSLVLITDIPGSENLILTLFANCFDVASGNVKGASGETVPKAVQYHLTAALEIVLEECEQVPSGVVDIVLAQFLRADPETMDEGHVPRSLDDISPAYNMARSLCNSCAEKLRLPVSKYFSSVLLDASETITSGKSSSKPRGRKRTHAESEDEADDGMITPPAETDFDEVEKAHRLLRELWRTTSDVVENVITQLDTEIRAENEKFRVCAVETVGDMIAGIGAAGPPPPAQMDPAAYPSQSLEMNTGLSVDNALYKPIAPHDFSTKFPDCYEGFMGRYQDRSGKVRSAWTVAAARIIRTSGGGRGLDHGQEKKLLYLLSQGLNDTDERVRKATIDVIATFDFESVVQKLGRSGSISTEGSLLHLLSMRIKDPKPNVRAAAMELLARLWGVASGAIIEGSERVQTLLGGIPTCIMYGLYVNNPHINALLYQVTYESLLPAGYPPIKQRSADVVNDTQNTSSTATDPSMLRVERMLTLLRGMDDKARTVFYKLQMDQKVIAKYLDSFLKLSEELNANSADDVPKTSKQRFAAQLQTLAKWMPDEQTAADHLRQFSKHNDRRAAQLIRFCFDPASDYRKIEKAVKEFTKRLEGASSPVPDVLRTMIPLIRNASILVYNKDHISALSEVARTDAKGLGATAHELIQKISDQNPEAFKSRAQEYAQTLKKQAPSASSPANAGAVEILKACAHFALRSPEDMPKDRDFFKAMCAFAVHGSPPKAAKHAVTVVSASADKKEMYVKDILEQCLQGADYGSNNFLSKLAALSQISLLMHSEIDKHGEEEITAVAVGKVLSQTRTPPQDDDPQWSDEVNDELAAKLTALKLLVNGIRGSVGLASHEEGKIQLQQKALPVLRVLNSYIEHDGELPRKGGAATPQHHRSQLRLAAAVQLVKLCSNKILDGFLGHVDFNRLSKVAQDPLPEVRSGFVKAVKKYLGQGKLQPRFYCVVFMYAFEPSKQVKESTVTWLKARAAQAARNNDTTMVSTFVRFISLLAHHQDFSTDPDELEDFVEYILFYLKNVATQENLPIIYNLAQRVKTVQDGIDTSKSENLYVLSDLAESIIRRFQEDKGWNLQAIASRDRLPGGIFATIRDKEMAQEIREKRYLPNELEDRLDDLVRNSLKPKKRKAEGGSKPATKKLKAATTASTAKKPAAKKTPKAPRPAKTPKKKPENVVPSSERRKSARGATAKSYVEHSDTEDDEEMEQWDHFEDDDKENVESSTPPTSDPTPAERLSVKKQKAAPQKPAPRALPARGGRARKAQEKVFEIPDDSDEELSDAPSEMEA